MTASNEPSPFLRVTVGSSISTSDGEKVGKVKEKRAGFLKVQTPFLQRDFWLAGDLVSAAVPDENVTLNVDKEHLDDQKVYKEPQTAA
jgi:hypothetical protein